MILARCPFCTHSNPAGARFCNECGSPLHLLPCERCEAVNDVLSRVCYRCGAPLRSEWQREPAGAPAFASVGDSMAEREATTVVLAYGDEPRTSLRAVETWDPAGADVEVEPRPTRDHAAVIHAATPVLGEPDVKIVAAGDHADGRAARRVSASARPFLAFAAAVAIIGLAALGGYTFIQRGEAPLEVTPLPPLTPAPAAVEELVTPAPLPQAHEPAPPGIASDTGKPSAAESAPKADRKPAPSPRPSQDAIETQRIIMRELGGFAPPTR